MITFILVLALIISLIYNGFYYGLYKTYEEYSLHLKKQSDKNFQWALDLLNIITPKQKEDDNTSNE